MIFSGNIAKIDIKYIRTYFTFEDYLNHLIKLKLLGEHYVYKKCLKKNKRIFPFDENIDILTTKDINLKHYDDLIKKIKNEINNSPWYQEGKEINSIQDFIELYNPKISDNEYTFNRNENKYPTFLPIYIFDKYLKPISFIGQLTKPKGIKLLSAYVCLSSSSVFYINKTEIDSFNNLFTLFQKNVSEDVIKKLFEGHFLFQDTDIDFLSKNYSRYFYIQNYTKGQKLIEQNRPKGGIFFINKGEFQLKTKRTYHELNELKFKIIQSLDIKNKNNLIQINKTSTANYENIYQGLNPIQMEKLNKEREISFNIYKFSEVVGLNDLYDSKTGLYNFSIECISDEGEVYFLPEEILTSLITNETIKKNMDELVEKQCKMLLREIDNKKILIEYNIKRISSKYKERSTKGFYLIKNEPEKLVKLSTITQSNLHHNKINNYNITNTPKLSKAYIVSNKENTLKNKILNKYHTPKIKGSRILSTKNLQKNNDDYGKLKLKTTENDRIYNMIKLKYRDGRNERNIFKQNMKVKNAFLTYSEQFKTMKKYNEENKIEIKTINGFKLMKLKLDHNNILNNQNKIRNIFKTKNGNKNLIKNTIFKENINSSE